MSLCLTSVEGAWSSGHGSIFVIKVTFSLMQMYFHITTFTSVKFVTKKLLDLQGHNHFYWS